MRQKLILILGLLGLLVTGAPSHAFVGPIMVFDYYQGAKTLLGLSMILSLIVNTLVFLRGKHKVKTINKSHFYVLLKDFWFEEFYIKRVATFVYFLCCWIFWSGFSYLVLSYFAFVRARGLDSDFLGGYLLLFLGLIVFIISARISIELSIALIKIAENTKKEEISGSYKA